MKQHFQFRGNWAQWVLILCLASCAQDTAEDNRVFRYNESANLSSLDPAFARTLEPIWVIDQLFDGLVELDEHLELQPLVAERFQLDSTGRVWTFQLRNDVFFNTEIHHWV